MSDTRKTVSSSPWVKGGALAVFVVLGILGATSAGDEPASRDGDIGRQADAWHACKEAVTERLSNPSTADFSLTSTDIERVGDGYLIDGTLTAANDYGAEASLAFACDVEGGRVTTSVEEG